MPALVISYVAPMAAVWVFGSCSDKGRDVAFSLDGPDKFCRLQTRMSACSMRVAYIGLSRVFARPAASKINGHSWMVTDRCLMTVRVQRQTQIWVAQPQRPMRSLAMQG